MNSATVTIAVDELGRLVACYVEDDTGRIDLPITSIDFSAEANVPGAVKLGLHSSRVNWVKP